jgi:hypothetical protein
MSTFSVSIYFCFSYTVSVNILELESNAKVVISVVLKTVKDQITIKKRYPNLVDAWCSIEGFKSCLQAAGNIMMQNNF